jgi:hypothetical protein
MRPQLNGGTLAGRSMLSFDDPRWSELKAGYRTTIDLRPLLSNLESSVDSDSAWAELWQELYHQGDVGEGSFAAVPHLVRIHRQRATADWNTYALVATIDLARGTRQNPDVPDWTRTAYDRALTDLAGIGLAELPKCSDRESVRSILALLALAHGARTYGRLLLEFSEDEVLELEKQAFGDVVNDAG